MENKNTENREEALALFVNCSRSYGGVNLINGNGFNYIRGLETNDSYSADELEVHFYFVDEVSSSEGEIYHDDGATPNAVEKGQYEILHLSSNYCNGQLDLQFEKEIGSSFDSEIRYIEVVVLCPKL